MKYPTLEWFDKSSLNSQLIVAVHDKQHKLLDTQYGSTRAWEDD